MKDEDWEKAFEGLLKLHLIEVPSDYYADQLYFTNTKVLKDLFKKLELDNLQMIHQQQDQEESYDTLLAKEQQVHQNMERNFQEQHKAKVELDNKIEISKAYLQTLRKKTSDGFTIYETDSKEMMSTKKGQQAKVVPVDFNRVLGDLRRRIIDIHVKNIGHGEVENKKTQAESKQTLTLLNVCYKCTGMANV